MAVAHPMTVAPLVLYVYAYKRKKSSVAQDDKIYFTICQPTEYVTSHLKILV